MITSADAKRVMFLSVNPKDGSIEAFDEVKDAVAHATDLVKDQDTERLIFVAMPRARVHMAVRVDPVEALPLPAPEPSGSVLRPDDWEKSQGFEHSTAA